MWKCSTRTFRYFVFQGTLGIQRRKSRGDPWNPDPALAILGNALPFTSLVYFFFPSCGWEAHETLNSHGEIIGMKMEKLNFDEAISGCFLIALSAVERRWRRSCRLFQFPALPQLPRPFALLLDTAKVALNFFRKCLVTMDSPEG